jgi:hypothetical protein
MDALMPLVGVIVGGVLVLLGDSVRRIAEWRRVQARELLIAGADLLAVYSKTVGELLEAWERAEALPSVHSGSGARREAATRFFALPGSEALRPGINTMITAHAQLRSALAHGEDAWDELLVAYEKAVLAVLVDLRRVHRRGRVPKDRLPSLSDVMSVSSPILEGSGRRTD